MTHIKSDNIADFTVINHDKQNVEAIRHAVDTGRIDAATGQYLTVLYSDGMTKFRELFYFLGRCFGAPKAPVMRYDYANDCAIDTPVKIADINPLTPYLVHHRLDVDPMRNQFFTSGRGHKINLAVSSIVTVIVGAQKKLDRSLDKITGKYYEKYINDVCDAVYNVIATRDSDASAKTITDQVRAKMSAEYISSAAEAVLAIIGSGHESIAVELVRALDRITPPYHCLCDVWRVKCLFDLVPQARTFIERVQAMMPERVLSVRDIFYDIDNPRNYRDAKLIINIGTPDKIVPLEIICQVRTFFEFELRTHAQYEVARRKNDSNIISDDAAAIHSAGVQEYNLMVCRCLGELFERVGWNILYNQGSGRALIAGFPSKCKIYYPPKIYDCIMGKVDDAIKNEIFRIDNAPAPLTRAQTSEIFRFMVEFILVTAMPYAGAGWTVPTDTMSDKLFNFVMTEVQRYYKKSSENA
ncbi:hypothetical protein HDR61_04390 [bacterium]|nr:hypothetical protein [bacterium]